MGAWILKSMTEWVSVRVRSKEASSSKNMIEGSWFRLWSIYEHFRSETPRKRKRIVLNISLSQYICRQLKIENKIIFWNIKDIISKCYGLFTNKNVEMAQ